MLFYLFCIWPYVKRVRDLFWYTWVGVVLHGHMQVGVHRCAGACRSKHVCVDVHGYGQVVAGVIFRILPGG